MVSALVRTAVKVLISGGLIVLVLRGVNISDVYSQIVKVSALNIAIALLLMTGMALIHAERWRLVIGQLRIRLAYGVAIRLVLISYFFNQTLPSTVGGDAFRVWGAYRRGISLQDAMASVVVDRVVALISLLLMVIVSSPWLLDFFPSSSALWILGLLTAIGAMGLALLLWLYRFSGGWLSRWRAGRLFVPTVTCARSVLLNIRVTTSAVALTIFGYVVVSLTAYLLACSMQINLEFKDSLLLMPLVIFLTILPVSIAGWGIREGAMVAALGLVGIPSVEALSLSILIGLVLLVSGVPGGLIWLTEHHGRIKGGGDKLV